MTKKNEKKIVKIAENEIVKFIKEWKKNPYLWGSETDIHAEIYIRIKKSLHKEFPIEKYQYRGMKKEECLDWIYCKSPIGRVKKGKKICDYPDISIFTYSKNKKGDCAKDKLIWICEIKYATDWAGTLIVEHVKSDIRKLKYFLKRENRGAYKACYLILRRYHSPSEFVKKILKNIKKLKGKLKLFHDSIGDK